MSNEEINLTRIMANLTNRYVIVEDDNEGNQASEGNEERQASEGNEEREEEMEEEREDEMEDECPICKINLTSELTFYTTRCGHKFHYKCCSEWFQKNDTCPTCRHVVITPALRNNCKRCLYLKPKNEYNTFRFFLYLLGFNRSFYDNTIDLMKESLKENEPRDNKEMTIQNIIELKDHKFKTKLEMIKKFLYRRMSLYRDIFTFSVKHFRKSKINEIVNDFKTLYCFSYLFVMFISLCSMLSTYSLISDQKQSFLISLWHFTFLSLTLGILFMLFGDLGKFFFYKNFENPSVYVKTVLFLIVFNVIFHQFSFFVFQSFSIRLISFLSMFLTFNTFILFVYLMVYFTFVSINRFTEIQDIVFLENANGFLQSDITGLLLQFFLRFVSFLNSEA